MMSHYPFIRRSVLLLSLLILVALVGCSILGDAMPEATTAADRQTRTAAVFPTATNSPEPTALPTATPEPTPVVPAVAISEQTLGEDAVLLVDSVAMPEAGWLAVYTVPDGGGEVLAGTLAVALGLSEGLQVPLNVQDLTETLVARLYFEREDPQALDYPGPDEPVTSDFGVLFSVDLSELRPSVAAADQTVGEDGLVRIDSVHVLEPSWLVIHADEDGPEGDVLGQLYLEPGRYSDLSLPINWRMATPRLFAVLHEDSGQERLLEFPNGDLPHVVDDGPVLAEFGASYPTDILVFDQPVIDSQVVIERVISNGPGWLVVHIDDNGQPGLIFGSAPVRDGLNERVVVELTDDFVSSTLHVRLHEDTEPGDAFNFPNADPPVRQDGRLPQAATFRTDLGSYLIVRDQQPEDGRLVAALVVATQDAWVVIHADDEGQPGEILGQSWVPAGINRDVVIEVEPSAAEGRLHAVLHQDLNRPQVFEFPLGNDSPLIVNRQLIAVPFDILQTTEP